jgi:excisionase family DNA binding protein
VLFWHNWSSLTIFDQVFAVVISYINTIPMENFYTIKELAATLKISVSTVRRMIRSGELDAIRVGAQQQLRVSESALQRLYAAAEKPVDVVVAQEPIPEKLSALLQTHVLEEVHVPTIQGITEKNLRWTVLNSDVHSALAKIPDASINCVVTSPPYYWQRDYEVEGQIGHESSIEGYISSMVSVFRTIRTKLHPEGCLFLNLGDTYYSAKGKPHGSDDKHSGRQMMRRHLRAVDGPGLGIPRKSLIGIPWRVALALQQDGWTLRSSVIWQRPAAQPEPTAHDRPWRTHENIFILSKGPRYWFNRAALKGEEDIWKIVARPENPGAHFAPYPRELVDRCIDCGCPQGGTVLDPFVGSGTTMVSALNHACHAVGIDIKPEYAAHSAKRIRQQFPDIMPVEIYA